MNSPSEAYEIRLATSADAAELAAIYDCDDGFPGDIAVNFSRGADPYASLAAQGQRVVMPVVQLASSSRIIGMGACVVHRAWVNGAIRNVGYLTGLKGLPEYRRRVPLLPRAYRFLREHTPEVELYYTTIVLENTAARRMLERPRHGMPQYRPVCDYTTYLFRSSPQRKSEYAVTPGTLAELAELTKEVWAPQQCDSTPPNLAMATPPGGVRDADVCMLRDPTGSAVAGCVIWDQRSTKQYLITRYGGRYRWLSRIPLHWLGYPRLPRTGTAARYASLALLTAHNNDPQLITQLLRGIDWKPQHDFLMVGLPDNHAWRNALAGLRAYTYRSTLFTVHFDATTYSLDDRPTTLDVGLL